ncbi:MAG: hypothetical protein FGM15_03405 [Chthoniobacterales bacterium]|nr:hypothetical protein [Chthoniobacterales bacterium]
MSPEIQAALITGCFTVLATVIGAVIALMISRKISKRQKLEEDLKEAVSDIRFLLAVEQAHCGKHRETDGESYKNRTRQVVRDDKRLSFSGRFTPVNWS